MFRFTIRDLLWLTVGVGMGCCWWLNNKRIEKHVTELESDSRLLHLEYESRLKSLDEILPIFLPGTDTSPTAVHPTSRSRKAAMVARRFRSMASPPTPKAVDLAFGKDCKLGVIIKEYRNSRLQYDPSEIVGTKRKRMRGAIEDKSICTSHVERNNGTIRTFMKRFLPADEWLLSEAREPRSGRKPPHGLLQLLLASREDEVHASGNGRADGVLLDVLRIAC